MVTRFINKHFITIVKLLCIGILLIFYYLYFFKDVIDQYSEGLTNFATKEETVRSTETPAITLCFSPPYKQSIIDEYEIVSDHFDDITKKVQMKTFVDQAGYVMNKDFELGMFWSKKYLEI